MGLIRKSMSISTLGAVNYRSKSEQAARGARAQVRTAKYAKQARNAARVSAASSIYGNVQNSRAQQYQEAMDRQAWEAEQARLSWEAQQTQTALPSSVNAPGWYADPYDARCVTWWDGQQWHPASKRLP